MKKDNPLITVVIVNYNGLKFLPRLIQSIYDQTLKDYEIILVDNGSKDNSVDYIKKEHSKIKLVEYINNGYGSSCNKGAKLGKGRYVVFLNEDMYLPVDFLEKMSSKYDEIKRSEKNIAGLSCKDVDFDTSPEISYTAASVKADVFGYPYPVNDVSGEAFIISGSPFFTERGIYNDIGGFSEFILLYGEDVDLSWRAYIFGYKLYTDNNIYLHHHGSAVFGAHSAKWSALTLISEFIPIINNYSLPLLILILPLYILYSLSLLLILFIKLGFKFDLIREYIKRVLYLARNIGGILTFRKEVQKRRVVSDFQIFKYMSLIPAFIYRRSWNKVKKQG